MSKWKVTSFDRLKPMKFFVADRLDGFFMLVPLDRLARAHDGLLSDKDRQRGWVLVRAVERIRDRKDAADEDSAIEN